MNEPQSKVLSREQILEVGALECSQCGAHAARVRAQGRGAVWVSCTSCMARTPTFIVAEGSPLTTRDAALERAWAHWNRAPLIAPILVKPERPLARLLRRSAKDE